MIWAPGLTTGYAALPLPELAEALESRDTKAVNTAINNSKKAIGDAANTAANAQTINATSILKHIEYFVAEGDIKNNQTARALTTHLTAVSHYEHKKLTEKVLKYLKGFKILIDQQEKNDVITKEAYDALAKETNSLIKKWE